MPQVDVSVLDQWEAAAAVLDPVRQEILSRLAEPDSATGVARALGLPRQRVAYHVRELEKHGLLETVEERRRGNCVERIVQATARKYIISPAALSSLGDAHAAADAYSSTYLIATAAETIRDVAELRQRAQQAAKRLPTLSLQLDIRFASAAARGEFAEELLQFLAGAARKYHEPETTDGRTYRFTVAGYPSPQPAPTTNQQSEQ